MKNWTSYPMFKVREQLGRGIHDELQVCNRHPGSIGIDGLRRTPASSVIQGFEFPHCGEGQLLDCASRAPRLRFFKGTTAVSPGDHQISPELRRDSVEKFRSPNAQII
jgi:hypothetical protein